MLKTPRVQTVTIPLAIGLRWGQKFPFKSPEWRTAFNLRSGVERKNGQLKHAAREDLNNPCNRPARGHAATSLDVAMLACAHNLRTVNDFGRRAERIDTAKTPRRRSARRAADETLRGIRSQRDGRTRR